MFSNTDAIKCKVMLHSWQFHKLIISIINVITNKHWLIHPSVNHPFVACQQQTTISLHSRSLCPLPPSTNVGNPPHPLLDINHQWSQKLLLPFKSPTKRKRNGTQLKTAARPSAKLNLKLKATNE